MWPTLLKGLFALFLSLILRPRSTYEAPTPAKLEDFNFPRAKEGQAAGWVYGTVIIKDPNFHWWDDLKTRPIKSKQGKKG